MNTGTKNRKVTIEDLIAPKDAWDRLSMSEKADMMGIAVRNGVTDLKTIREKYNEFAEGGDTRWTMEDEAKYMEWRQSLPDNLRLTNDSDYDMRAAFKAGMQPTLEADGLYHLGSRDPETGRILKAPHHPTYLQAINTDARMGYYPVVDDKGQTYTHTWEGNKFGGGGGFASLITMPMILPRNTEGGKKQRKILQFLPIVGTAVSAEEAIHNPTQYNIVRTGISAASDLFGLPMWRGAKAGVQLIKEGLPTTKEAVKTVISPITRDEAGYVFSRGFGYGLPLADTEMDVLENTKAEGGKIHIKPSHRGRLTELKAKTGKTEAELYNDGNPAHRKMVVFARNARKWHGEGGPLQGPLVDMAMANMYAGGGSTTDDDLVDFLIKEEGNLSKPTDIGDGKITLGSGLTAQKWHDLYKRRGNKWSAADNRRAVAEEVASRRRWAESNIPNWDRLPASSQKALLSYKYNYDFTPTNSPKLFKALSDFNLFEAARQMDATSKDSKFKRGLVDRRKREQEWFLSGVGIPQAPTEQPVSTAVYNPYRVQAENTIVAPQMIPDEDSYIKAHPLTESELRRQKVQERWDAINRFNSLMELVGIENNPLQQFEPTSPVSQGKYSLGGPLLAL